MAYCRAIVCRQELREAYTLLEAERYEALLTVAWCTGIQSACKLTSEIDCRAAPVMPHAALIATFIPTPCTLHSTAATLSAAQGGRTHKSWPVAQIAELHHARYLLQPRAIELFMSNGASALLSFVNAKVRAPDSFLRDQANAMIVSYKSAYNWV